MAEPCSYVLRSSLDCVHIPALRAGARCPIVVQFGRLPLRATGTVTVADVRSRYAGTNDPNEKRRLWDVSERLEKHPFTYFYEQRRNDDVGILNLCLGAVLPARE